MNININESYRNFVWPFVPKEKYTCPLETQLGVVLAPLLFHSGYCETFVVVAENINCQ